MGDVTGGGTGEADAGTARAMGGGGGGRGRTDGCGGGLGKALPGLASPKGAPQNLQNCVPASQVPRQRAQMRAPSCDTVRVPSGARMSTTRVGGMGPAAAAGTSFGAGGGDAFLRRAAEEFASLPQLTQ